MPASIASIHDTARGQRTNQVQFIEERLRNGISPAAVAGITALLAQLETQTTLASMALSIVADVAGNNRTMTCREGLWNGYDLRHPFLDDRSTLVNGPSTQVTFEQEATLRVLSSVPAPQPLPPAHLVFQPQLPTQLIYLPKVQQLVPTLASVAPNTPTRYASAPAVVEAPHMILHTASSSSNSELAGSSQVFSARVQSALSSAPSPTRPLVAPNMANRKPSEQAVIQALQAVANYPESRFFVETVLRSLPGLRSLVDTPLQLEGCMSTRTSQGPGPSTTTPRALSPIQGLSPVSDEEPGRKRVSPHELTGAASASESPTSRPPLTNGITHHDQ